MASNRLFQEVHSILNESKDVSNIYHSYKIKKLNSDGMKINVQIAQIIVSSIFLFFCITTQICRLIGKVNTTEKQGNQIIVLKAS